MAGPKRKGRTSTFSVADRAYGGNVSALIEAIAVEAGRQEALEWLLHRGPAIDDRAFEELVKEMKGSRRKATNAA